MRYGSHDELVRQCGGAEPVAVDSRTVYYDGGRFPFEDGEFDYVICSHVLEHVPDVAAFCAELFRVGKRGYLEYPLIYYDFVYDIPEHLNVLKKSSDALVYLPKAELALAQFAGVQELWFRSLCAGYNDTVGHLLPWLMEGFEWFAPFETRRATGVAELLHHSIDLPAKATRPSRRARYANRFMSMSRRLASAFRHSRS
jgi:SAM-dependent methyltransferase